MALPALLGGAGISLAAHELLLLTGNVFGVSSFVHDSLTGNTEALAGIAGLVASGVLVATLEDANNISSLLNVSPAWLLLSGFLVGLGTKVLAALFLHQAVILRIYISLQVVVLLGTWYFGQTGFKKHFSLHRLAI